MSQYCSADGACTLGNCTTNAECMGATPFCTDHECTAACSTNDDCQTDPSKPYCQTNGACTSCVTICDGGAPTCDETSHQCRACITATDCDSQVCNIDGTCADATTIAYASAQGSDAGTCTVDAPCKSLGYLFTVLSTRPLVLVEGDSLTADAPIVLPAGQYTIAADHATISGAEPLFSIPSGTVATVTFRGLHLVGSFAAEAAATLVIEDSELDAGGTSAGTLSILRSTLHGLVTSSNGSLTYRQNLFSGTTQAALALNGGTASIENSVFSTHGATTPIISVGMNTNGSLSFSTIVDSQPSPTVSPLACALPSNVGVTSSIVAWNNANENCATSYSVFNGASSGTHTGIGNAVSPVDSLFVDLAGSDFHLQTGSRAVRAADPGASLATDFAGDVRPNPAGTARDCGAFESAQ